MFILITKMFGRRTYPLFVKQRIHYLDEKMIENFETEIAGTSGGGLMLIEGIFSRPNTAKFSG